MLFRFNHTKSLKLLEERGICFEDIISAINEGNALALEDHENQERYPDQAKLYVLLNDEVYVVPFVIEDDGVLFLKTIFPSRKARKRFFSKVNK